jgi:cytochrome c biogenesis protein CcdA/thiol-disulfide isomerase/thioredoxin
MGLLLVLLIAFAGGLITAFTPCILPVLPILLAGGAAGGRRRPYAIVAGLVASFTVFTLAATEILRALHLRGDRLNQLAFVLLLVLAVTLVFPRVGTWLERPFYFLTRRRAGAAGGGFVLGASLGLVFVPCAGPVLAVVSSLAGRQEVGFDAVLVTLAYALGTALPMLLVARGGLELGARLRAHARPFRVAMGVVMAVAAVAIYEGWETSLQTKVPGYASKLQNLVEDNGFARRELRKLRGGGTARAATGEPATASSLPDYGQAPELAGVSAWLNSPPLTMAKLRGKVVLVDFWTYSCINCIRTLPHLESWDRAYRSKGLVILGVHTPEFAFEHVLANVRSNAARLGVRYPVALDNDYATWNAYGNQYWPAEYLVDRNGHVRHAHFGEGQYGETERLIRQLLGVDRRRAATVADTTPTGPLTPETYLGYARLGAYVGSPSRVERDREASYRTPSSLAADSFAYGGRWRVGAESAVAGRGARLAFRVHARKVFLVLGGRGTVAVRLDGKPERTVRVSGNRLYTLVDGPRQRSALLELRLTPGLEAFAFTFG